MALFFICDPAGYGSVIGSGIPEFYEILKKKESSRRSSGDPINGGLIWVQFRMNFGKSL